jgi:hypothetical protein
LSPGEENTVNKNNHDYSRIFQRKKLNGDARNEKFLLPQYMAKLSDKISIPGWNERIFS